MHRFLFACVIVFSCTYHDGTPEIELPAAFSCDTIRWQQHILPIMANSCAVSGCHEGVTRLDWRDYDEVKKYAASVKTKTQDGSMPIDSSLPQVEIDMIACWVDKGAPEN
jgi:hypothetical protein